MIIVEGDFEYPLLLDALERAPGMEIEWIRTASPDEEPITLFWARGGDFERFVAGLEADPTVTPNRSIQVGDDRLYQATIVGRGIETDLYPTIVEVGGMVMSATATHEGWHARVAFPDQEGLDRYFEKSAELDIDVEIRRLTDLEDGEPGSDFGLTDVQRETLLAALEAGFFDVPRESSLEDLADYLGISEQSASERLRRGTESLIRHALAPDVGGPVGRDSTLSPGQARED